MGSRWETLTATRGRSATIAGSLIVWLVVGFVLTREPVLGRPAGVYAALGLAFAWTGLLAVAEARWRRQDAMTER